MRIMNRIATSTEAGLEYEADQRHAEIIVMETGLTEESKEVVTPGASAEEGKDT